MRKICTGYSCYYNIKYMHSGTIIQGKYKSKLIANPEYLQTVVNYIHLNPYGIEEPDMNNQAKRDHMYEALGASAKYEYSSFQDYLGIRRSQSVVLSTEVRPPYSFPIFPA